MQEAQDTFAEQGLNLVGLSYDSPEILKDFSERHTITFPLLADPKSEQLAKLGLVNLKATGMSKGVSIPGTLFLDSKGKLKSKFFEDSYRNRLTANTLYGRLFPALVMPAKPIQAEDFSYSLTSTDSELVMGSQLDLLVDIELPKGYHLYSPGSSSYVPLSLELEPHELLEAVELKRPLATLKRLEAIEETVGVYSDKVRLRQTIRVKGSKAIASLKSPQTLLVKGKLGYQVCTDTTCLMPNSLPVQWKLTLNPLDFKRAPKKLQRKP